MLNVMLVDDEALALEYIKHMTDWEANGYRLVGSVTSSRQALALFDRTMPEIVISDIRMPIMDGLELTRRMKEKNRDVEVILLSAYGDFEYAKKGIEYGVFGYLLKHELNEKILLEKLNAAEKKIKKKGSREKIYQKYFMEQLIYQSTGTDGIEENVFSNRLFLVLCHKRSAFCGGETEEAVWNPKEREALLRVMKKPLEDRIFYTSDVWLAPDNWLLLFQIEHISSQYEVNRLIERKCAQMGRALGEIPACRFNFLYSPEITQFEISETFRKMSNQIRYHIFFPINQWDCVKEIPVREKKNIQGMEEIRQLGTAVYETEGAPDEMIRRLFLDLRKEEQPDTCKSLILFLNGLLGELLEQEHLEKIGGEKRRYTIEEIGAYYEENFKRIHDLVWDESTYSDLIQEVIRYIRKNYEKELSLDMLGSAFGMNGVYLGQIFRKEVGTTFLKYLTEVRMEEAKRLLKEENISVSETAKRVGYRTSQYFCKVFGKAAGMSPWEFKRWKEKD